MSVSASSACFDRSDTDPGFDPVRLAEANINPGTFLATDYLNHFNEAIMMLEMLAEMPDCIIDLVEWRPLTYPEHFHASNFKDRELAVQAYEAADLAVRARLDKLADTMNMILVATRDAILTPLSEPVANAVALEAVARLKPLVAEAGGVINGRTGASTETDSSSQATIDALLNG